MIDFLSDKVRKEIACFQGRGLNEIRLRSGCPITLKVNGETVTIEKLIISSEDIEQAVLKLCKNSLYSYEDQLKKGFLTSEYGERVGIAGEVVKENGNILTIKNFTSLCIRIPSEIKGVSNEFYDKFYSKTFGNVLVLSPSGVGKTTFIRDLIINLSDKGKKDVVVIDERNEISLKTGKESVFNGKSVDVLTFADKSFGFNQAVRTLNPSVIVTDELFSEKDAVSVVDAIYGGTMVVTTAHASTIEGFFNRKRLSSLKKSKIFDYYVVIKRDGSSRIYEYFDKNYNKICF
ncbi:MAG: Flp pilus assembly complex ATPase component TadA [Clostridia bacterium]|nr:Flp pilus assembly complex ATPase component TadA [Clostridia bacterium]